MSQENVALVRLLYDFSRNAGNLVASYEDEEWVRAGLAAFGHLADPEFEFVLVQGEAVAGDAYPGPEGFQAGMREWLSDWETYVVEAERFIDLGERVLVLTVERGVSRAGGVPVEQRGAVLYTFRGEKILRTETFLDRATALAAVGLESEQR